MLVFRDRGERAAVAVRSGTYKLAADQAGVTTNEGSHTMTAAKPARALLASAVAAALSLMAVASVSAQDAPTPATSEEATTLDAIIVTAQKREEQLQDVPIAITALSERLLQDTGVRDVKDLQILVPGLTVTSTPVSYTHLTLPTTPYV